MNVDTGRAVSYFAQDPWYWKPSVALMNHPSAPQATEKNPISYWPITAEDKANFGINTYGPDVLQNFVFDFMDRQQAEDKPFFVYHAMHLGHGAYD